MKQRRVFRKLAFLVSFGLILTILCVLYAFVGLSAAVGGLLTLGLVGLGKQVLAFRVSGQKLVAPNDRCMICRRQIREFHRSGGHYRSKYGPKPSDRGYQLGAECANCGAIWCDYKKEAWQPCRYCGGIIRNYLAVPEREQESDVKHPVR